jgi:hypothetical protein
MAFGLLQAGGAVKPRVAQASLHTASHLKGRAAAAKQQGKAEEQKAR